MARDLKEDFFRLDGAWASFELMSIGRREDYLKLFRVLRCKIDDQVDFDFLETVRSATEATVSIEIFGEKEVVTAGGQGPVDAVDNAMRKVLEKHYPQLSEVRIEGFDVRLLHHGFGRDDEEKGAGAGTRAFLRWTGTLGNGRGRDRYTPGKRMHHFIDQPRDSKRRPKPSS
jgi:2-isopropylmalate synthase